MIDILGLHFAYAGGGFRLDIPSFQVQKGEKLAVIEAVRSGVPPWVMLGPIRSPTSC